MLQQPLCSQPLAAWCDLSALPSPVNMGMLEIKYCHFKPGLADLPRHECQVSCSTRVRSPGWSAGRDMLQRSPGQEIPGAGGGLQPISVGRNQFTGNTGDPQAKQNKHTQTPTGVVEGAQEHKEGITSFVSLSQRGFGENVESWKRNDLGFLQLVLGGQGGGGQLGGAGGGTGTSLGWRDGSERVSGLQMGSMVAACLADIIPATKRSPSEPGHLGLILPPANFELVCFHFPPCTHCTAHG